jgi:hypothetical protein
MIDKQLEQEEKGVELLGGDIEDDGFNSKELWEQREQKWSSKNDR